MSKTKTATDKAAATAETAMANGAEALKAGFDKAIKNYDLVLGYSKDTAEAVAKSATVAGKGVETLNNEIYAYSKQSLEDSITATKAVMGSKSLHEAFEYQSDYAKSAFEGYIGELTKFGELFTAATKNSFAPLQGRVEAWLDVVQTTRA
jgi:phasin family protein